MKRIFISLITVLVFFNSYAQDLELKRLSEEQIKAKQKALERVREYLLNAKTNAGMALPAFVTPFQESQAAPAEEKQDDVVTKSAEEFEIDESKSSKKHSERLRQQIQQMIADRSKPTTSKTTSAPASHERIKKNDTKAIGTPSGADILKAESGWKGRRPAAGENKAIKPMIRKAPASRQDTKDGKTLTQLRDELELKRAEIQSKYRTTTATDESEKKRVEPAPINEVAKSQQNSADKVSFQGEVLESDSLALVAIRSALAGLETYWPENTPVTVWQGVWLDVNGRVEEINIEYYGVTGALPEETGNLTELRRLFISGNAITALPASFSNLVNLEYVYATSNELSSLPSGLENLGKLRSLSLGDNNFEGPVPTEVFALDSLEWLSFWMNGLTSVGAGISNMKHLRTLELTANNFEGAMPEEIFALDSLRELYFRGNQLTLIGEGFGDLAKLEGVYLQGNQIASLPSSLQNLDNLKFLELAENQLKTFPDEIAGMQNVEHLYMWDNQIFDEIPAAYFSDLTKLRTFDITNNRVFGAIPTTIAEADSLEFLYCADNVLNKPLPAELGGMAKIQQINFSNNLIPGVIPTELGQATTLWSLYMPFNKLEGTLPVELSNLVNLQELAVYYNEGLSGEIPAEFGNLTSLTYLDLDGCGFSGTIPASFGNLTNLYSLWLRENNFSGDVPDSLGRNLYNLGELMIEYNQLTGLPSDVSGLTNLNTVMASNNNLEFDDFEPLESLPSLFNKNYDPQNQTETEVLNVEAGTTVQLDATIAGSRNHYEWYNNRGEYLEGFDSGVLTIENFTEADAGFYQVWVTSDSVNNLTLYKDFELGPSVPSGPVSTQDSLALVALYEATTPFGDAGWERDWNWLQAPVAEWEGVIVENGRVVGLDLGFNNLQGGIPPEIANLTELRYLNLRENNLQHLASEFYNLTNLTWLDLEVNELRGGISPLIGNLINLDTLLIGNNPWEGEIPEELYSLINLRMLTLDDGQLSGQISPLVGNLTELRYLAYSFNGLTGTVPTELTNLTNLEHLYLGQLPRMSPGLPDLSGLTNLRTLHLGGSRFLQGQIPAFVADLTNLEVFYAYGNDLSSGMPSLTNILGLSKLRRVDIGRTGLSGVFPYNFDQMDSLEVFWMYDTDITGFSADSIRNHHVWQFSFFGNELTEVPPFATPTLLWLELQDNQLTSLPDLSNLPVLEEIFASNNNLTFDDLVPFAYFFTNMEQYRLFDVAPQAPLSADTAFSISSGSNYDITINYSDTTPSNTLIWYKAPLSNFEFDSIGASVNPYSIVNATNPESDGIYLAQVSNSLVSPYTGLYLESGRTEIQVIEQTNESDSLALVAIFEAFQGHLWDFNDGWLQDPVENWVGVDAWGGRVRGLYLYDMYGEIPPEVADLDSLEYLQIVRYEQNGLFGEIPAEIFNLEKLQHFDVGGNFLTGPIPETVGNATQLKTFSIWNNQLTGTIPESMGDLDSLRNFWADQPGYNNAYLEGSIPEGWSDNPWETFRIQNNRFDELPVGLDTAFQHITPDFQYVEADLSRNDFDMNDLVRGVGMAPYYGANIYIDQQNFRRELTIESIDSGQVVLTAQRLHPDDQFNWYIQYPWDPFYREWINNTGTDSVLILADWEAYRDFRILTGVTNENLGGIYYEEYSNVVTLNMNQRRFATGGEHNPEHGENFLRTPINSITGPPDNYPWDDQLRNWWHNQSQPDFDTLTLFFDDPIPVNYFKHHGMEINLRSIAFRGSGGEEVIYEVNRTLTDQFGYSINKIPKTGFAVSEVELILSNGSMDAFEIGDDGIEGVLEPPFIDEAYTYTHGKDTGGSGNGYIGFRMELKVNYIRGVAETYIERSTDPENGFVTIDTTVFVNMWYNDFYLPSAGTYYYRVRTRIGEQVSGYSNVIKACNVVSDIPGLGDPQNDDPNTYSYWDVTSEGTGDFAGYTGQRDSVIFVNEYGGENNFGIQGPYHGGFFDQFSKNQYSEITYFMDDCGELALYAYISDAEFPADSLWGSYENDTLYLHWRDAMNGIIGLSKFVYVGPVDGEDGEGEIQKPRTPNNFEVYTFSSDSIRMRWDLDYGYDEEYPGEVPPGYEYYQDFDEPEYFIIQRATGKTGVFANFDTLIAADVRDREAYFIPNLQDETLYRYRILSGNSAGLSYPSGERGVVHKIPFFDPSFGIVTFDELKTSYGGAFADIDNDGDQDLYIANAFQDASNLLYENLGDGEFSKITTTVAAQELAFSRSASFGDYDNDGFPDLFVPGGNSLGNNANTADRIYRNTGAKTFEITNISPVSAFTTAETGVWVDLNNDGLLDIVTTLGVVLRNNNGQFEVLDTLKGYENQSVRGWTLRSLDIDQDGDQDIYATDDQGSSNRLYLNDGTGILTLTTEYEDIANPAFSSQSAVWFDADNDSDLDMYIGESNPGLYLNEGGTFSFHHVSTIIDAEYDNETGGGRGVTAGDFDNDGYQDLVWIVEGRPYLILNNGDLTFHVVFEEEQLFPEVTNFGHIATADVNNDGFLDLLFLNGDSEASTHNFIYLNNGNANSWVNINLKGVNSNASGIGAKVFVTAGGQTQFADVTSQNGIGSGNSLSVEFGLGSAASIENITVEWPSGDVTEMADVSVNQFLTLSENVPVNNSDSAALVALYNVTGGAEWSNNTGWFTRPPREWHGVFFNKDGRVTAIVLNQNNLTGSIPQEITTLTELEVLDLSGNSLTGGIPGTLGSLTALKSISLNDNDLDGSIPPSITQLANLKNIDLYNNRMKGELPVNIGDLDSLKQFEIQNNQFIGFLPESFGTLDNLEVLNIGNNSFEGEIPAGLGGAEKLQILNIRKNGFTGTLPGALGQLSNLVELKADSNQFTGNLPVEFAELTGIGIIDLSANELTGSLEPLSTLESADIINVSNNKFTELSDFSASSADSVLVRYNFLDFGDFESNISVIESGLVRINPQDSLYERIDSLHEVGTPITIFYPVEGALNTYQWYLDGEPLADGTFNEIVIQNPDTPNEGEYVLEVKNELFPEITLFTSPFNLKLSSLERDRRALIALYDATQQNGAWTNDEGWSSQAEDLNSWFGVTVEADRVTRLELPDNNMDGLVPREFADLSGLKVIDLSGNSLRSFVDVSQFSTLRDSTDASIDISDNRLAFRDIMPNVVLGNKITYAPQKRYDVTLNDTIQAGDDYILSIGMAGTGLQYQWQFGPLIPGKPFNDAVTAIENANSRQFLVENINYDKQGTYRVDITHPQVPGLTITSRNRNLWASTDLFGTVFTDDSGAPLTDGEVFIYRIKDEGPYFLEDSVVVDGAGEYAFEDLVLGDFIVQVKPEEVSEEPGANVPVQTYYEQAEDYLNADTLQVRERIEGVDIQMVFYTVPEIELLGADLGGEITSDFEDDEVVDEEDNRIDGRRKVKKAGCSMRKFAGTGRTGEDEYVLFAYVESDDEGRFSFKGIPDGEYLLNIQYPGVPMDPDSDIKFVLGGDVQEQVFELTVEITEDGISVVSREVLSVPKPYIKDVKLYPNPTEDVLIADFMVNRKINDLKLDVVSVQGVRIFSTELDHRMGIHRAKVDMTPYESGVYFMVFTDEAGTFRHQIKIGKK